MQWYDSSGPLSSGNGITVGNAITSEANVIIVLDFNPFRTAHGGRFSCRANIMSPAPPFNITKTSEIDIVVGGKFTASRVASTILTSLSGMLFQCYKL